METNLTINVTMAGGGAVAADLQKILASVQNLKAAEKKPDVPAAKPAAISSAADALAAFTKKRGLERLAGVISQLGSLTGFFNGGSLIGSLANQLANLKVPDATQLKKIILQGDTNAETRAATQIYKDEQDPRLNREQRAARLRSDYLGQVAGMDRSIVHYKDDSSRTDDTFQKLENQGKILDLERKQLEVKQKVFGLDRDNTFVGTLAANIQKLSDAWSNFGANAATFVTGSLGTAVTTFSTGIASAITHTKSWATALRDIRNTILTSLIDGFVKMVVQWVLAHTLMAGISRLFNLERAADHAATEAAITTTASVGAATRVGVRTGETAHDTAMTGAQVSTHAGGEGAKTGSTALGAVGRGAIRVGETIFHGIQSGLMLGFHVAAEIGKTAATIAGTAIRIPLVLSEVIANVALAAMEAFAAVASIPYVGPFLAFAVVGEVLALGAQMIAKGFAAGGIVRGEGTATSDSIMARLSNGEHVTQAGAVSRLGERFMAGINAGVVDLSALNPGASVRGGGVPGGAGSGSGGSGGGSVQNFHFGFHTDESTTLKHLDTVNGRKFLVNASRQTVREVSGKS